MSAPGPSTRRAITEDNVLSYVTSAAERGAAEPAGRVMTADLTSDMLLENILTSLEDGKAEGIVKIDLRGKSEIADWMVVASGRSSRQVAAIADNIVERLKHDLGQSSKVEGKETGDWVLIDAGDVIVHVFRPEVRDFYQLEKMWLTPSEATASRA